MAERVADFQEILAKKDEAVVAVLDPWDQLSSRCFGDSIAMGAPKMDVLLVKNASIKWMITRGTPILGNLYIWKTIFF